MLDKIAGAEGDGNLESIRIFLKQFLRNCLKKLLDSWLIMYLTKFKRFQPDKTLMLVFVLHSRNPRW